MKNENTSGNSPEKIKPDVIKQAHEIADMDMKKDPEFDDKPDRADDLDEGELARLEGEK